MAVLLVVVGAMLAAVLFAGAGDRLRLPWPVLLLLLGAAAAFVPGIEAPDIEPDLILPLFLPPLLYATAQRTSWALFRLRWRTIAFLAIGLVVATVAAVAGTLVALTGIGLAAALAIGAAVAPPDPVAVEAVAGPLRVPRRIMATLQSEGLFNDATALVVFQTAVAAAVAGNDLGALGLTLGFLYGAVVAVAIGLVASWLARRVLDRLTDVVAGNGLTLVLPFAVYLAADALHASGVIAVVVVALQLRQHSDADASEARLTRRGVLERRRDARDGGGVRAHRTRAAHRHRGGRPVPRHHPRPRRDRLCGRGRGAPALDGAGPGGRPARSAHPRRAGRAGDRRRGAGPRVGRDAGARHARRWRSPSPRRSTTACPSPTGPSWSSSPARCSS